jgi:DNA-binding winged helix-turn-helix (wHTH) protein
MQYVFGDYTLDVQRGELRTDEGVVRLDRQVFAVLAYLVQHCDRVVRRQELFEQLWPDRFVSEAALERCVAVARRALGDSGRRQRVRGCQVKCVTFFTPAPVPRTASQTG